jgi:hypothetical protein
MSARPVTGMDRHPDILELRARYDRAAETIMAHGAVGLTFLGGLYLAISPWVVGFFGRTSLTVNNLLTGIAVASLAIGLASAYGRTHGVAWVTPLIGVWTIIAPWVMSGRAMTTKGMICSNVVAGAVILVFGMAAATVGMLHRR